VTLNPNTQHPGSHPFDNNRHGANFYSSYIEIHETVMQQFRDISFVSTDTLQFISLSPAYYLEGKIYCLGQIVITVDKGFGIESLLSHDDPIIRTKWYSYNVSIQGIGNIFRYDNQDKDYFRPGHRDEHHKHTFMCLNSESNIIQATCEDVNSPIWVGHQNWPTLGDVIQEAHDWYWDNYNYLPNPLSYASSDYLEAFSGIVSDSPSLEL
jgi:hypothetical protein